MDKKGKKYFKVEEPMPGLFEISSCFVQMHLLVGEHHALLVDTGYGFTNLPGLVREITDLPLYIVNSHGHVDHACGNSSFRQPVFIHPADIPVFKRHNSAEYREIVYNSLKKMQSFLFFLPILPKELKKEDCLHDDFDNFLEVREGHIFDLGGKTAEVIELPGHTPGSIGLYCRELKLLITSDAINSNVYMFLPESTKVSVYRKSLHRAKELDFDYFVTGHQSRLFPKSFLDDYIEVVEHLDYEKGIPQKEHEMAPGKELRRCIQPGKPKRKAAGIVVSEDKLD